MGIGFLLVMALGVLAYFSMKSSTKSTRAQIDEINAQRQARRDSYEQRFGHKAPF